MRRTRVDFFELGMQPWPATLFRLGVDLGADRSIGLGQGVEAGDQRAVIKHRAAHEQWKLIFSKHLDYSGNGVGAPAPGRVAVIGIDEVDEMMRHRRTLGGARLGGTDVHAAIHLRRVDRDDLERRPLRKLERQARLAARRRAEKRVGDARQG